MVSCIALAIASGHESTSISLFDFLRVTVERQRIPLSCSMSTSGSTPLLRATESIRAVASLWDGQPPAFPRFVNISKSPSSSLFNVINKDPQPVFDLIVVPVVFLGRGLGEGEYLSVCELSCAEVIT